MIESYLDISVILLTICKPKTPFPIMDPNLQSKQM